MTYESGLKSRNSAKGSRASIERHGALLWFNSERLSTPIAERLMAIAADSLRRTFSSANDRGIERLALHLLKHLVGLPKNLRRN